MNCPQAAQIYYLACGTIDRHNRCRQSTLGVEKKLGTKSWDKRVNMTIFGMIVVDAFLLHRECTGGQYVQAMYYKALITALIENSYGVGVVSRRLVGSSAASVASLESGFGSSGWGLHITPTKRVIPDVESVSKRFMQTKCRLCNSKTIFVCSECRANPLIGEIGAAFCGPLTGRTCYRTHMEQMHDF
jgi:hypothetical protein